MKLLSLLIVISLSIVATAQQCNCMDEFKFVKNHIEKNHGGFNKKIKSPDEPAYKKFTDDLEKQISEMTDPQFCLVYLKKYILYLKDHHSNITGQFQTIREDSAAAVEAFLNSPVYKNAPYIRLDSAVMIRMVKNSDDPLKGVYETPDGTYQVAVMKVKNSYRDYVGVILHSNTRLWTTGQIKFEFKLVGDSVMEYYSYLRNHGLNYDEIHYTGTPSINGWVKKNLDTGDKMQDAEPGTRNSIDKDLIKFTVLDDQTTLLSIRSFSSSIFKTLDSTYKKVIPEIKKHPNLIIDVRNNGGGADFSFNALLPLLYTDTVYGDVVEIYNTPGNVEAYKKFNEESVKSGNRAVFERSLSLMAKGKPNSFVPMGSGEPSKMTMDVNKGFPNKIAIVYNRQCASSCESLLFDAMYSKKTLLVGENSGGFTGYGDVMNIQTPCGNNLSWTTTVYKDQWKYEMVGIPPQYRIPETETDWIDYTRRLLEKQ